MLRSILEGLSAIWEDKILRYYFIVIAVVTFLLLGPFTVGIPVLAHSRYAEGAMALGTILSSFGGGSLVGIALAAAAPKPPGRAFPAVMLTMCSLLGIGLILLGLTVALAPAAVAALIMGLAEGYVMIQWITWMQIRTPAHMLGRVMSVLMFSVVGLAPFQRRRWSADPTESTVVLVGAGGLIVLVAVRARSIPWSGSSGRRPWSTCTQRLRDPGILGPQNRLITAPTAQTPTTLRRQGTSHPPSPGRSWTNTPLHLRSVGLRAAASSILG